MKGPTGSSDLLNELLALSHGLGREERKLAILGEGNTSVRSSQSSFLVKASGASLGTLEASGLTECRFDRLLGLLAKRSVSDEEIHATLLDCRVDPSAKKPSVEAMFHAYLLSLPGVAFVGHTHPIAVNALLCSKFARVYATKRLFPDEIVCCGIESVYVPYTDPGLKLAQAIKRATEAYIRRLSRAPRVILLENHGLIALGANAQSVLATTLMAVKAAEIFLGAAALGGPRFLSGQHVLRIADRPDEHYRQRALGL